VKHARRISYAPTTPLRWAAAVMGVWTLVATVSVDEPRYTRVVEFAVGLVALAVGIVPAEYRPRARAAVLGLMTVLLALAGVVAALSMDEAMTLVAGGILAGLTAPLFGRPTHRARHAAPGT